MSEGAFSKRLRKGMLAEGAHSDRIENTTQRGTPDIYAYGAWTGWIETKVVKRNSTVALDSSQALWLIKHCSKGVDAWIVCWHEAHERMYAWHGSEAKGVYEHGIYAARPRIFSGRDCMREFGRMISADR